MSADPGTDILKGVSRSFYLSLRFLPAPMRDPVSLAYLLARTSDTIADTPEVPAVVRSNLLTDYADSIARGGPLPCWPQAMLTHATPDERKLFEHGDAILAWLRRTDEAQSILIREVLATIIGGQLLDLERFGEATPDRPVALPDAPALEDYAWRVAGCVGAFWTETGFLKCGAAFSEMKRDELREAGIEYGKGLQLVNILRDLPDDLAAGRCYLPVGDPSDREEIMAAFRDWRERAWEWNASGIRYAATLKSRRLRIATVLPALIARETLALLDGATWEALERRVKVPRRSVYRLLVEALFF